MKNKPYKVKFKLPSDNNRFILFKFVLACDSKNAKTIICNAFNAVNNEAVIISARKVRLSKCAFYKKFGKDASEKYFKGVTFNV